MSALPIKWLLRSLLSVALLLSLIPAHAAEPYSKEGISFSLPAGWFVSEDEEADNARFIVVENDADAVFIIHSYRKQRADEAPVALEAYANWNAGSRQEATTGAKRDLGSFNAISLEIAGKPYSGIRNEFSTRVLHLSLAHRSDYFLLESDHLVAYASSQAPTAEAEEIADELALLLDSIQLD